MRRLGTIVLALFITGTVVGEEKKPAFDSAKMVGDWTYTSGMKAGEKVPKDNLAGKVTFTKDTITVPAGPTEKFLMAYKIDAKTTPATITMEIKDGPVKEGKAVGIVAIDGDEMKLCYVVAMGKDDPKKPAKFESTKENQAFFFVLKRAK